MTGFSKRNEQVVSSGRTTVATHVLRIATAVLLGVSCVLISSTAQANEPASDSPKTEPTRYAVRAFEANGVDSNVAGAIETSFCNALAQTGADVLCSRDVQALMVQTQVQLELGACDNNEQACLEVVAKASNASRIVTGEVSKVGEVFQVSVAVLDPKSSRVVVRGSEKEKRVERLLEAAEALARSIREGK